jgi:hypothetical protein
LNGIHKVQDDGDDRIVPGGVHMEAKAVGLNWNGMKVAAKNKGQWWCVVDAPVLQIGVSGNTD